jgi:hypothetical protein
MWHALTDDMAVPHDRDLRLAVIGRSGEVAALVFPSRVLELVPTHWQPWKQVANR